MYSKFKELIIGKQELSFILQDDREFNYVFDQIIDSWRGTKTILKASDNINIKCDNRFIYVDDKIGKIKMQIFLPYDVRTLIDKDTRMDGMFELSYRQHLRQLYSKKEMTVINMNFIPDIANERVEKVREKAERYSHGKADKPVVVLYYNENVDTINYAILKDSVLVESGSI